MKNLDVVRLTDDFNGLSAGTEGYKLGIRKQRNIPGSYAIYYKIVDASGKTIRAYKETYDPQGNLIHVKEKN